jgi:glycosyltransferase involved in cell wall biosynthesis
MRLLPQNYHLRLVGRTRKEKDVDPDWLVKLLNDPLIKPKVEHINAVPIHQVADQIDLCDIVLLPASNGVIRYRYTSPLKAYDYMVRGKPIVAADVPCHHELLIDGENAALFRLDPQHLADCIIKLADNPDQQEKIARSGWEQAIDYTYPLRAEKILALAEICRN